MPMTQTGSVMAVTCFLFLDLAVVKYFNYNQYVNITERLVRKKDLNYIKIPIAR